MIGYRLTDLNKVIEYLNKNPSDNIYITSKGTFMGPTGLIPSSLEFRVNDNTEITIYLDVEDTGYATQPDKQHTEPTISKVEKL